MEQVSLRATGGAERVVNFSLGRVGRDFERTGADDVREAVRELARGEHGGEGVRECWGSGGAENAGARCRCSSA